MNPEGRGMRAVRKGQEDRREGSPSSPAEGKGKGARPIEAGWEKDIKRGGTFVMCLLANTIQLRHSSRQGYHYCP